jgi:hypothetical protein
MHCAKNLAINLNKIILGEKKSRKIHLDLQMFGVYESLWLKLHLSRNVKVIIPLVPWVMQKEERISFLETMSRLKLPIGYTLTFKKHIVNEKVNGHEIP